MPGYRRFVTYLFRYENGRKGGNCGFAKVEVRQDKCRIEIQAKGYQDQKLPVYLFARKEEKPEGIYLGELTVKNGVGNVVFFIAAEMAGDTPYGIDDMRGLYLQGEEDVFIASQWDDVETDWSAFSPYIKPADEKQEKESAEEKADFDEVREEISTAQEMIEKGSEEMISEMKGSKKESEEMISEMKGSEKGFEEPESFEVQEPDPELHATQAAQTAVSQPYQHADAWEQQWQRFTAAHPVFCPFDEDEGVYGVKMNLRDFKILPKQYWYLANNSFLLHGYFNYRYVLFGYMDGEQKRWFMGVPGVFQNQEQILAGAFGFPEFRTKQLTRQKTGEFGYWYRYLEIGE